MKITREDLKKSQKCPVGTYVATVVTVEEPYLKDNGNEVQKMELETTEGYVIPTWFNANFKGSLIEFVQAADNVTLDIENMPDTEIDLKDYVGKKVTISVVHGKDKNGKIQAQIENFFSADKVPF